MPRVKIDHVVSFSNEDPEHPASNLLSTEVSKRKWLCSEGQSSCSVVLGLARAARISSLQVGAHRAALVEVLVARSESPGDPFEVLVASSVFMSPQESRGVAEGGRVRSFPRAALAAGARDQRWDRVRVVCSQPYNKRCKYGLAFIHIFEGDEAAGPPPLPLAPLHDDDDTFIPGELFAAREAGPARPKIDEVKPARPKIDEVKPARPKIDEIKPARPTIDEVKPARSKIDEVRPARPAINEVVRKRDRERDGREAAAGNKRKSKDRESPGATLERRPRRDDRRESAPLREVVFALSGYQNPERARLRDRALGLGARYRRDWGPDCTHLVCAFSDTPKLRAVRGAAGGEGAVVVTGGWVDRCWTDRRRVPWEWYATEPRLRRPEPEPEPRLRRPEPEPEPRLRRLKPEPEPDCSERDTDDEIEKVRRDRGGSDSDRTDGDAHSDRTDGDAHSDRTDGDAHSDTDAELDPSRTLPAFLEGLQVRVAAGDGDLWRRYVSGYGGRVVAGEDEGEGLQLRADWLWSCHRAQRLLPYDPYVLL